MSFLSHQGSPEVEPEPRVSKRSLRTMSFNAIYRRQVMKSDKWFCTRAKELYHRDGQIEVNGNARISRGDDEGAYVEAWVWVPLKEEERGS